MYNYMKKYFFFRFLKLHISMRYIYVDLKQKHHLNHGQITINPLLFKLLLVQQLELPLGLL